MNGKFSNPKKSESSQRFHAKNANRVQNIHQKNITKKKKRIISQTRFFLEQENIPQVLFVFCIAIVVGIVIWLDLYLIFSVRIKRVIPSQWVEKTTKNAHSKKKKLKFLTLNNNENSPNSKNLLIVCFFFGISLCIFVRSVQ